MKSTASGIKALLFCFVYLHIFRWRRYIHTAHRTPDGFKKYQRLNSMQCGRSSLIGCPFACNDFPQANASSIVAFVVELLVASQQQHAIYQRICTHTQIHTHEASFRMILLSYTYFFGMKCKKRNRKHMVINTLTIDNDDAIHSGGSKTAVKIHT